MRCRECDYPLWRIPGRACPECGASFRPSEFDFVPNAVCFRCPHCEQEYYGRDHRGHLYPVEFDCVSCGQHVHMDDMALEPTAGVTEERTQAVSVPWFERKNSGTLSAWWRTVGHAHIRPGVLMKGLPNRSMLGSTFYFCAVTQFVVCLVRLVISAAIMGAAFGLMSLQGGTGGGGTSPMLMLVGMAVGAMLLYVVFTLLMLLILGAMAHGLLMMTGARAGGLSRTYDAYFLSSGALVLSALPSCLSLIGVVWWMVSATISLAAAQRVSGIRAVFAVCLPPVLAIALSVGGVMWMMMSVFGTISTAGTMQAAAATAASDSAIVQSSVASWLDTNATYPAHAMELILSDDAQPFDFCGSGTTLIVDEIPVERGTTLRDVDTLSTDATAQAIVGRAIAALPADVTAHRLGDFVFTWHGISPTAPAGTDPAMHGQLWIAAYVPEPGLSVDVTFASTAHVAICVDGSLVTFPVGPWQTPELAAQNNLRATFGLPPLPSLELVTHANPARGSSGN